MPILGRYRVVDGLLGLFMPMRNHVYNNPLAAPASPYKRLACILAGVYKQGAGDPGVQ